MWQLLVEKPNRLKETMLAQEEAYMNKVSEARATKSLKGHPWGQKPDAMFQVRLTDTWTEDLFGNLSGAVASEQLLEVMRFLKNEGEKCKACREVDLLSFLTRPGGSVLVAGCARTTGTVARR